jgi:predicted dehydrogenase
MPAVRKAKELMARPEFGTLRSILAVFPMTIPLDGAGVLERLETTLWLTNGCHPLSAMLELGGQVRAVTTVRGPAIPAPQGARAEAVGAVHLAYASGAIGTLFLAGGSPAGHAVERYEMYGDQHVISVDDSARVAFHRGIPFDYATTHDFTAPGLDTGSVTWQAEHRIATLENKALFIEGFFDELEDFCRAIIERRPLRIADLAFTRHLMKVYEAALLSDGAAVTVE